MNIKSVGAGLFDARFKTSDGEEYDINAVISSNGEPAQDEVEVKGDDELKATFISNLREELTISANGIDFDTIQAITGNTQASSANGLSVALGTDSQMNPPFVELLSKTKSKDDDGTACELRKTWHKLQIKVIKVTQEGESEFSIEMTGIAYQTETDIEGNSLTSKRIATLEVYYS